MTYKFRIVKFSHIYRKGNVHAHLLAKHAISIEDFSSWIEENPYFLELFSMMYLLLIFPNKVLVCFIKKKNKQTKTKKNSAYQVSKLVLDV